MSELRKKLGPRYLTPKGEDAFGDRGVIINYYTKVYDV